MPLARASPSRNATMKAITTIAPRRARNSANGTRTEAAKRAANPAGPLCRTTSGSGAKIVANGPISASPATNSIAAFQPVLADRAMTPAPETSNATR